MTVKVTDFPGFLAEVNKYCVCSFPLSFLVSEVESAMAGYLELYGCQSVCTNCH